MNVRSLLLPVRNHDERGVTLVELLVTMGLLSIFLVILTTIFTSAIDVQSESSSYSAVTADGRYTLARLEYDIRRASAISTPANPGDNSAGLVLDIEGKTYAYALNSGRLQLTIDGTGNYLTSDGVVMSGLNFQQLGSGGIASIRYSFTVTSTQDPHNPLSQTYASTTELRL